MTKIEWTDETWNPVTGCTKVSQGCKHCYAERMATRLRGRHGYPAEDPFRVTLRPERLSEPLGWRKPRRVFVCSMSDLFEIAVPANFIKRVLNVCDRAAEEHGHTFQILTKRPKRMRSVVADWWMECQDRGIEPRMDRIWLGTSVENQATADERIPHLLQTPAVVRFLSCEPLLGPIDLGRICLLPQLPESARPGIHVDVLAGRYWESGLPYTGEWDVDGPPPPAGREPLSIDWVIVGGESGPGARPMDPEWARSLRNQCATAGVAFFFKQWGGVRKGKDRMLDGRTWDEFPTIAAGA